MAHDERTPNARPEWGLDLESGGAAVANGAVNGSGRGGTGGELPAVLKPLTRSEDSGNWFGLLRNSETTHRAGHDGGRVAATELEGGANLGEQTYELVWHAFGGGTARGLPSTVGEEPVAARRKYTNLKRSHSFLWELWNREGSGSHHVTTAEIMAAENGSAAHKPVQESDGYIEAQSPAWGWAGKLGAALQMKYAAARTTILALWLLVGLAVATYVFVSVYLTHHRQWNEAMQAECAREGQRVEEVVYQNEQELAALRGFVETTYMETSPPILTQSLFQQTTQRTAFTRPLCGPVLYAKTVWHSQRAAFEGEQGKPIVGWGGGVLGPEPHYGPVLFAQEPPLGAETGYPDILQAPVLREAADRSVGSGELALSAPQGGLVWIVFPIYRPGFNVTAPPAPLRSADLATLSALQGTSLNLITNSSQLETQLASAGWLVAPLNFSSVLSQRSSTADAEGGVGGVAPAAQASDVPLSLCLDDVTNSSVGVNLYTPPGQTASNLSLPTFAGLSPGEVDNLVRGVGRNGLSTIRLQLGDSLRVYMLTCSRSEGGGGGSTFPFPWAALGWGLGVLLLTTVVALLMRSAGRRIKNVEGAYRNMKTLRDQTLSAKLAAEHADTSKSHFLATVSHEIRTPLNGVLGMLSLLKDTPLDAVQIDYVQTAVSSGKALIGLINDVLDFSKIEAGKMEIESTTFDIRAEVDDVLSLFAEKVRSKNIDLAGLVQLSVPQWVVGDSGRFRQVLINLIGNASKFTEEGHILVAIRVLEEEEVLGDIHRLPLVAVSEQQAARSRRCAISGLYSRKLLTGEDTPDATSSTRRVPWSNSSRTVSMEEGSEAMEPPPPTWPTLSGRQTASGAHSYQSLRQWLHEPPPRGGLAGGKRVRLGVSVEDTGMGIPLAAQGHIFQPFRQADSSTSRKAGGTGIGLSISKKLVELQGGNMGFVSTPSVGSTFFFDTSVGVADAAQISSLGSSDRIPLPQLDRLAGLRVLVVDDHKVRRQVVGGYLRALGVRADFADSPTQALAMAQNADRGLGTGGVDGESEEGLDSSITRTRSMEYFLGEVETSRPIRVGEGGAGEGGRKGRRMSLEGMSWMSFSPFGSTSRPERGEGVREGCGYAVILVDSESGQVEQQGLAVGRLLKDARSQERQRLVLLLPKPNEPLEAEARTVGFRAVLHKPLRKVAVAVALIQALGLATAQHMAQIRQCPGADNAAQLKSALRGRRILCVDDNLVNRRVASKMLAKFGVEAEAVPSGAAALEHLRTQPAVDLVFMDLQMPEMDGFEASQKIRELEREGVFGGRQHLPIVAMTADVLKGTKEKCLSAGMDGYITKPIDTDELLKLVLKHFPPQADEGP